MVLLDVREGLRAPGRWIRGAGGAGFDEDWTLVLLGVAVIVITLGLAVLTAWTVHQRDTVLQDARAAAYRLDIGGWDDRLYQDLITTQQDEVALFQAHVDAAGQGSGPAASQDPRTDLDRVESDLTALTGELGDSPRVQRDITLITREISRYTALEAAAQADNQQGLPVGAAYLREASGYLTTYTLPSADDIQHVDQARIAADDAAAGGLPWPLLVVDVLGLACLLGAQIVTARYSRRLFNAGLALATVLTVVVIGWSAIFLSISLHVVSSDTAPHARAAAALAQARVDGIQTHTYDLLTLVDHGEDCSASTPPNSPPANPVYKVTCTFETQVGKSLAPKGKLRVDLTRARRDAPDPPARAQIARAAAAVSNWLTAEHLLPTLQNLENAVSRNRAGGFPRYSKSFEKLLRPYAAPHPRPDGSVVTSDSTRFQNAVKAAIEHEWQSYEAQAASAGGTLTGLVTGALLLGLLAGAAVGGGIGWRVNEYWSAGQRAA